jgi:hypothetical protein
MFKGDATKRSTQETEEEPWKRHEKENDKEREK